MLPKHTGNDDAWTRGRFGLTRKERQIIGQSLFEDLAGVIADFLTLLG